uniref:RIC3 acetylcholine receptor chaperone n=1 Tax=Xiphophorus couchianus TaxID=32473 RepID=A0A3B5KRB5_9TELE
MSMSTFQKVTLATCLVLCVALLLPKMLLSRGRKDAAERPEGSGRFPPMMHRQMAPEGRGQRAAGSGFSRTHNSDSMSRAKGAGTGTGTGGKSNLAGQIIPVYGFGILLYILYILFKEGALLTRTTGLFLNWQWLTVRLVPHRLNVSSLRSPS